jgi:MFS transporter, SP family, ERD6-like sugar transporter
MSFREESGSDDGRSSSAADLKRPFLHTGSWYRMGASGVGGSGVMGSRQSSLMDKMMMMSSAAVIKDTAISALLCTMIVALGPIQFGFTGGYSSPTQSAIIADLGLSISEVLSS